MLLLLLQAFFLSEGLIGLIVRLWVCFAKSQGLVPNRLIDRMGLPSSSSSTARVQPTALSSPLSEVQRAAVVASYQTFVTSPPLFLVCLCLTGSTV